MTGTFLAFATAPGNVAEDGDIADGNGNGLYTQYLLQELQTPAAKIEDVFKRVRLSVRKKSQGRQIPWESTSLEEDFYFNDGIKFTFKPEFLARVKAQSEAKRVQRQAEESKAREREQQVTGMHAEHVERAVVARQEQLRAGKIAARAVGQQGVGAGGWQRGSTLNKQFECVTSTIARRLRNTGVRRRAQRWITTSVEQPSQDRQSIVAKD